MNIDLKQRTAVVTGGASNIGRGISLQLADSGAQVIIVDKDVEQAQLTAALRPGRIRVMGCDLSEVGEVQALGQRLASEEQVAILVNNAGWVHSIEFAQKDLAQMDFEIRLNLLAPLVLTRLVLPGMLERHFGRIVSVASEAGRVGQRQQVAYSAAKGGVLGMTRSLAHEVGRYGVTVNAVSPAMTIPETADEIGQGSMQQSRNRPPEMMAKIIKSYPVGRVGHPRDIAGAVTFLVSDEAEFITGQTLPVNGGFVTT
ncbi:SDR family NAD(P)-dependent oxidoreductase [Paraburkholderia aspalathi]|uniref:2-hydroxycyclohexanecarboxyl-CoA dehydrogenase n=1 Tax=Paraburkholderia aspalathi TaxID=1324617 RepID=A0A1I7DCG6_9BURK|nr:SDR family NAD(P)-dependent oxidoreductase [Paraburkholderia aspalathi]SFU09284.1 2-hydroxycyclohexanecarboxyl-CoA dehydrogenase [Paraburkholderia aspalathi]